MLIVKEKDNVSSLKIYINFRAKKVRVCRYLKANKVYETLLPFTMEVVNLVRVGSYNDIMGLIKEKSL